MNKSNIQIISPVLEINQKNHKTVCLHEVIMLRGDTNYTTFCMKNGKSIMMAHTLKYFEDKLNEFGFLRVHKAFLVNPEYILKYDEVSHKIEMGYNLSARVSRRRAKGLNMNWTL